MRTRNMAKGCLGIVGIFFVATAIVLIVAITQFYRFWIGGAGEDAELVSVEIEDGSSLATIADDLESDGIIANAFWFKVYAVLAGESSSIQAGLHDLRVRDSYADIMFKLTNNFVGDEVQMTLPEGLTIAQMGEVVVENFDVTQEEWSAVVGVGASLERSDFIQSAQKPDSVDLEGYLFPDTYRFFSDATANDIAERLVATMEQRVTEEIIVPDTLPAELETMHDVLTLASIVQREVRNPDEMAMVADIFLKRLEIGMALQADSTVNYITGKDTPAISLDDRDIDSPYNTYQYPGLPPGPISNPGADAIRAVLYPTSNEYYYFLTTDEGEVIYAVTHDQHVQNKNIYLR